ncbi:hypothetical protein J6590_075072 [Homalodisca vitripennis]|nr:hypothetical protein J6590_075072 [Homalodisca vitripennis]
MTVALCSLFMVLKLQSESTILVVYGRDPAFPAPLRATTIYQLINCPSLPPRYETARRNRLAISCSLPPRLSIWSRVAETTTQSTPTPCNNNIIGPRISNRCRYKFHIIVYEPAAVFSSRDLPPENGMIYIRTRERVSDCEISVSPTQNVDHYQISVSPTQNVDHYQISVSPTKNVDHYQISVSPTKNVDHYQISVSLTKNVDHYQISVSPTKNVDHYQISVSPTKNVDHYQPRTFEDLELERSQNDDTNNMPLALLTQALWNGSPLGGVGEGLYKAKSCLSSSTQ